MIEVLARILACTLILLSAAARAAEEPVPFPIGYLEFDGDARYERPRAYAGIEVFPRHRPLAGAEVALRESRMIGRALGTAFELEVARAPDAHGLSAAFDRLYAERGVRFFLVDADADALIALARHAAGREALLFNVSEPANRLRAEHCAASLLHTMPSRAMLSDALVQYLVFRRWTKVLVLEGPEIEDGPIAASFAQSARKFGARVVDRRDFVPGNDPRERERNNIALMTQGADYDVIFVADAAREFARHVPYASAAPRPVVGAAGLRAGAWHWTWERHGAPQLNQRFERLHGRRMGGADWAAWAALKAIVGAVVRARSTESALVRAALREEGRGIDGYKGARASFRAWDGQLRQPILLHTQTAVIARAPIRGFLHPTQNMDTLGYDAPEQRCAP